MNRSNVFLVLVLLAATPVMAQQSAVVAESRGDTSAAAGASVTAMATVAAIDLATRQVTLREEDGGLNTIIVGEEARNLAQVEVGDRVIATYDVGLVVALGPPGAEPVRVEDTQSARTALGEKPGGIIQQTVAVTATVMGVNMVTRTVTLRGPRRTIDLPVADDIDLTKVKVGDQVGAVYRESFGLLVEAPE